MTARINGKRSLYTREMSVREIPEHVEKSYQDEVAPSFFKA